MHEKIGGLTYGHLNGKVKQESVYTRIPLIDKENNLVEKKNCCNLLPSSEFYDCLRGQCILYVIINGKIKTVIPNIFSVEFFEEKKKKKMKMIKNKLIFKSSFK